MLPPSEPDPGQQVAALWAGGIATMWEAVFADVGVTLLAILNAVRIQRMNFTSKL